MPQASDDLRDRITERFGSIDDYGPQKFLEDAGYRYSAGWLLHPKPGVKNLRDMTRDEFECALFLVHEWDYGIGVDSNGNFKLEPKV
jgi:hypothetical protein